MKQGVPDEEESDHEIDKVDKLKQNLGRPFGSAPRGSFLKESDLEPDDENNPDAIIQKYKEDQLKLMHEGTGCRKECCDPMRKVVNENEKRQQRRKKVHDTA